MEHGWDEHIPEESAISKKMEIRKFAQIQGEDEVLKIPSSIFRG